MTKLLVGILKGAVIGGGLGYGAHAIGFGQWWLVCGLAGLLIGLVVGKPIWSLIRQQDQTMWVGVIKGLVGFGVCVGLWALVAKAWSPSFLVQTTPNGILAVSIGFVGAIGAIYGGFVELDDAIGDDKPAGAVARPAAPKKPAPRK